MFGVLLSQILGISRMMFAMSRRQDLPGFLHAVDPKYGVPRAAIVVSGLIILLFSVFGTLEFIISTASFTILLYYSITNIAALKLGKEYRRYPGWIAALGLISCLCMAASLNIKSAGAGLLILALGFLFRWITRKINSKHVF